MDQTKKIELLKKIEEHTRPKQESSILLTNTSTDFYTILTPPMTVSEKWKVGLLNFSTFYSYFNIISNNNVFKYYNGNAWRTLNLALGAYSIDDINSQIQLYMASVGDDSTAINVIANEINGGTVINITNPAYQVDMTVANGLNTILGFNFRVLNAGYNLSDTKAQIVAIDQILVNCSIIKDSYLNSNNMQVIYSFAPDIVPFKRISQVPNPVVYYSVNASTISTIRIWLTDQNGNAISLNGEPVSVRLHFKSR